jgi:hypothetical protein
MLLKKLLVPALAFSIAGFGVSCANDKNEKDENKVTAETI